MRGVVVGTALIGIRRSLGETVRMLKIRDDLCSQRYPSAKRPSSFSYRCRRGVSRFSSYRRGKNASKVDKKIVMSDTPCVNTFCLREREDRIFQAVPRRSWIEERGSSSRRKRNTGKLRGGRAICRCRGMNDRIEVNGGDLDVRRPRGKQMPVDLRGYAFGDNGVRAAGEVAAAPRER